MLSSLLYAVSITHAIPVEVIEANEIVLLNLQHIYCLGLKLLTMKVTALICYSILPFKCLHISNQQE